MTARRRPKPDTAREVWSRLFELGQLHRERLRELCGELDLTLPQAHLLRTLDPGVGLPMSGLAGLMTCDASNVTGLVDKLEARGLVERRQSPGDRRVKMIVLTAAGTRLRGAMFDRLLTPPACIAALSTTEQRLLARLLERVAAKHDDEARAARRRGA